MKVEVAATKSRDGSWSLVDGRNRLDGAEAVGMSVKIGAYPPEPKLLFLKVGDEPQKAVFTDDPWGYVLSANVHRRHLTPEQKRDLIAKVLKAQPSKSNRQVAKAVGVSHPHVAAVRAELEKSGDVETVTTSIDTMGRKQPTRKPASKKHPPASRSRTETPLKTITAEQAVHKLRDQIDAAVATAIGVSPMQPIIDAIFDIAAAHAERNGNVKMFIQRVRQRIDAMVKIDLRAAPATSKAPAMAPDGDEG
jgi:DNA-binding Lrp family transcriptional regulator